MALIKFGGGVVGMAGKIGGTVYARNRYGQYARSWANPVNPRSDRQTAIRGIIGALGDLWGQTLTDDQRAGWENYASNVDMKNRLGETIQLSGFNHFCRSNAVRIHAGLETVLDAPAIQALAEHDTAFAIDATAGSSSIEVTFDATKDWVGEAGAAMLVHLSSLVNGNIQFYGGSYRYAGKVLGDASTPPTSPATITYPGPTPQAGQRIFAKARVVRADGRVSEFFRTSGLVS